MKKSGQKKSVQFSNAGDEFFEIHNHAWTTKLSAENTHRNLDERTMHCVAPPSSISRPNYEGMTKILLINILGM